MPAKETLYNYDAIARGGRVLILQEGPFDVLKIDAYGAGIGVRSVGLSTNSLSDQQVWMIEEALDRFDRLLVMMDNTPAGLVDSMEMAAQLRHLGDIQGIRVPYGRKDGGALTADEAIRFTDDLARKTTYHMT